MSQFGSLQFYLESAERAIGRWGHKGMYNNEDAISHVAYFMMRADEKFIDGQGSRDGYRMSYAKFGILTWIRREKRKPKHLSLDTERQLKGNKPFSLADSIPDGNKTHLEELELEELIDTIRTASFINPRQKSCILKYFIDDMTLDAIGQDLGITHEGVRLNIRSGLEKIRMRLRQYHYGD